MGVIADVLAAVDAQILNAAEAGFAAIAGAAGPVVTVGGALIIAAWGAEAALGIGKATLAEFAGRIGKIALFGGLVGGAAGTFGILYGWFNAAPEGLGAALMGGAEPGAALDAFYERGTALGERLMALFEMNGTGLTWLALGLVVWLAAALLSGFAAVLVLMAKIAVAVLIAVAPVFLLAALFKATRSWFEGWLRGVLTQAMVLTLTYGVLAFLLNAASPFVAQLAAADAVGADVAIGDVAASVLVVIMGVLMMAQVPGLASAVGGGAAVAGMGAWGAAISYLTGRLDAALSHGRLGGDWGHAYQRLRGAMGGRPAVGARDHWAQPQRFRGFTRANRARRAAAEDGL
jgi:type IV secretion system protein VirB6